MPRLGIEKRMGSKGGGYSKSSHGAAGKKMAYSKMGSKAKAYGVKGTRPPTRGKK